jgi:phosphoribosylformimino-5-aminoimidazole carboxamide ribotide isomerase
VATGSAKGDLLDKPAARRITNAAATARSSAARRAGAERAIATDKRKTMNLLQVIPVIDLRRGTVVHARFGERAQYRPLQSMLCKGSTPAAVIDGLLGLYPFATVYAADLDAIEGTGDNADALRRIKHAFPQLELWVDAGFRDPAHCRAWLAQELGTLVLGSEGQSGPETMRELGASALAQRVILSLDFRGDQFIGSPELLHPGLWPTRVIAMTLARVGSGRGPDIERLARILAMAGGRRVYAAGGARHGADLHRLARLGAAGVLVASALHDGRIGVADLAARA